MQKRRISVVMSKKEWILGLCWLPFYFLLLSLGIQLIFRRIAGRLPDTAELNAVYYAVNAAVVLLIFRRFLRGNLTALRKNRRKLPLALPTALLLYFFLTFAVGLIILALDPEFVNRNNGAVLDLLNGSPVLAWTLTVLAAPLIEETLFRGLIFGSLRRVSRVLAYAVTMLCFSGIHVVSYIGVLSPTAILLSLLQYVPATAVLCGLYEYTDTIYAPMLLHAAINVAAGLTMGALS